MLVTKLFCRRKAVTTDVQMDPFYLFTVRGGLGQLM